MYDTPFTAQEKQQYERNALKTWLIGLDECKREMETKAAEHKVYFLLDNIVIDLYNTIAFLSVSGDVAY